MTAAILLDTHILLWMRLESHRLKADERDIIAETPLRWISAASMWEMSILVGLNRIRLKARAQEQALLEVPPGFRLLPIGSQHCMAYRDLPLLHRDPFDRMLIAQALEEDLTLLSRDSAVALYREQGLKLYSEGKGR